MCAAKLFLRIFCGSRLATRCFSVTIEAVGSSTQQIIGNKKPLQWLQNAAQGTRRNHALRVWGPQGVGKRTAVVACIAAQLTETLPDIPQKADELLERLAGHPDVQYVAPEESVIGIAAARELKRFLSQTPSIAARKFVVIDGAEYLTHEAANALLKFLEEPQGSTTIFLIAHDTSRMLPTIVSRTVGIRFSLVSNEEIEAALKARGVEAAVREEVIALAHGLPGKAIRLAHDTAYRKKLLRRREAVIQLMASPFLTRLAYVARGAKQDPEALDSLPKLWLPRLRQELFSNVSNTASIALFIRRLFDADKMLQATHVNQELLLERSVAGVSL